MDAVQNRLLIAKLRRIARRISFDMEVILVILEIAILAGSQTNLPARYRVN